MKETRAGAATYFWWVLACVAIWGDVFLKAYRPLYPHLPYVKGLLHAVSLLFFAVGWGVRKKFDVWQPPRGDWRFWLNRAARFVLLLGIFATAIFAVANTWLFPSPQAVLFWDYVCLAAFVAIVVVAQILLQSYFRMARRYGTKIAPAPAPEAD